MRTTTRLLALLGALTGLLLAGCGEDSDTGGSMAGMDHGGAASTGPALDRAFAQAMVPHHESAIEMATVAQKRATSSFVRTLSERIIAAQTAEISDLEAADRRLASEGAEVGAMGMSDKEMTMDMDIEKLRGAEPFDETFLEMMIEHHRAAVRMAEVELQKGSDPALQGLASEIVEAQETEISQMRRQLEAAAR